MCCSKAINISHSFPLPGALMPVAETIAEHLLHSARQHPSYGDYLEVKAEYHQNCSVLGCACDTMFTVSSTLIWAVLTGPADWVCHIGTLTPCIEAVAWSCIIVTSGSGPSGIQALSARPSTGFLQCFDTAGWVIWPVKTRSRYDL